MKKVYITWHYTTHGIAFLKHILSEFYLLGKLPEIISVKDLNQQALNTVFDEHSKNGKFVFDEVVYIIAKQEAHDKISSRRFSHREAALEDPVLKESKLFEVYTKMIKDFPEHVLEEEIHFLKTKHKNLLPEYFSLIWRNIQHYPINEQIKWLIEHSNFKYVYDNKLTVVELDIDDLRNEKLIADKMYEWTAKYFLKNKDILPIINVSLGSSETQVVWHILAESGKLPRGTKFVKTYDDKNNNLKERFKNFAIQEVPTNLISTISLDFTIYTDTTAHSRKLVNNQINFFLKSGFSILMIGERGIGKTQIANRAKNEKDVKMSFEEASCAVFENNDNKAEAALFGVEKGTFTDVLPTDGLMLKANGGILFLDEFHYLSKAVQAKLMKALSTDKDNCMTIQKLGNSEPKKVELQLIFATNKTIPELKELLLPDFYDRVVQHVITIPPLRDTPEDRMADWMNCWRGLFEKKRPYPALPIDKELERWLRKLPLYGNYRDLQKIAMYYNVFTEFDEETKSMLGIDSPFKYAKSEFEKYHSNESDHSGLKYNFNDSSTTKQMIAEYCYELQDWAVKRHGNSRKKAIEHFQDLGDTVVEKTFNDWKNKASLKNK
jgi:DNA-binding NtrC family response regulator